MGIARPLNWISGNFHGVHNMDLIYKIATQVKTVAKLLGSKNLADKYVNSAGGKFLSRGHLTAKADFVYGSAQSSTFWYLNAAPQWQTFNGGNWNSLEDNVRVFASTNSLNLIVYTGTHGQMSLLDENNNRVPIYLRVDKNENGMPVPKFFWKIIYDSERMLGTAFVGVNDPYAEKITSDMLICKDVSDSIRWLTWKSNSIDKGISYACSINELMKTIPTIPKLEVKGLLY